MCTLSSLFVPCSIPGIHAEKENKKQLPIVWLNPIDRATERSSDRATEQSSDRSIERPSDRAIDRATERPSDRPSDRSSTLDRVLFFSFYDKSLICSVCVMYVILLFSLSNTTYTCLLFSIFPLVFLKLCRFWDVTRCFLDSFLG